jgi:histidine triad (HIT) family protein
MYSHQPPDYDCPFCSIIHNTPSSSNRSTPADLIYENEVVTAFIGLHQWANNPGNTIIIPNQHYENIFDLPVELSIHIHRLARAVAFAMKEAFHCDGISLRQHNETAGNQDVWHYHIHVTPRYQSDQFYANYLTGKQVMPPEERAQLAQSLHPVMTYFMEANRSNKE